MAATVCPDTEGPWTFEVQSWSDPIGTWLHDAGIKIRAGVDVELMFAEGVLLLERVLASHDHRGKLDASEQAVVTDAIKALGDTTRPVQARLAAAESEALAQVFAAHPLRDLLSIEGPYHFFVDRRTRAVLQLVRVLPPLRGCLRRREDRQGRQRHAPHRRRTAPRRRGHGLRRDLPAADPPDRRGEPQGLQQHAHPHPRRRRLALGDRQQGRRARRHPPRPRHVRRLRRVRGGGARASAWRWRSTSRSRPRRTTRGRPSTRSGSPPVPTAPSRTPRTRRRSTRTSTRSTSTTTPTGIYAETERLLRHWMSHGVRIFRVDNPHTKPVVFWEWLLGRIRDHRPGRAVPLRGVHHAADDAGARHGGLPPELHLLHLAQHPQRDRDLPARGLARDLGGAAAELLREHPRHPARVPAVRRPAGVQDPGRGRCHRLPELGRLRRLRALRAHGGEAGQRGVPRLGEVPDPHPRLGCRRTERADAGAVPHPAQRDPACAPRAPAAAQRDHPLQRRRRRAGLQQDPADLRGRSGHCHRGRQRRPARPAHHDGTPRPTRTRDSTGRTPSQCTTRSPDRTGSGGRTTSCTSTRTSSPPTSSPSGGTCERDDACRPGRRGGADPRWLRAAGLVQDRGLLRGPGAVLQGLQR